MKSILITGNRGFIASGLNLEADGIDIKDGVDIISYKPKKRYDVVVHTAALVSVTESIKYPDLYFRTNVEGTLNLLRQHPEAHFVYLSTCAVYGEGYHSAQDKLLPTSPYAKSKVIGESAVRYFAKTWAILRLTNVIGEGERGEPNVYQIFEKEDVLPIYGDGEQTRDFIHVDKVRQTIKWAMMNTGIYNIGSGVSMRILDVAKSFNKPIKFLPERPGEIKHFGVTDALHYLT